MQVITSQKNLLDGEAPQKLFKNTPNAFTVILNYGLKIMCKANNNTILNDTVQLQ